MRKRILFNTPTRAVTRLANKVVDDMIIAANDYHPDMIIQETDDSVVFKKEDYILRTFFKVGRQNFGKVYKNSKGYYLTCGVLNSPGCGNNKLVIQLEECGNTYELYTYMCISTKREYVTKKVGFFGYLGVLLVILSLSVVGAFELDIITFLNALGKLAFLLPLTVGSFWLENRINPFKYIEFEDKK